MSDQRLSNALNEFKSGGADASTVSDEIERLIRESVEEAKLKQSSRPSKTGKIRDAD